MVIEPTGIEMEFNALAQEAAAVPLPDVGDWCVRSDRLELIARWIPEGAMVGSVKRILVLGDVGRNATLITDWGGARIDVMGNVEEGARLGALGAGAHILICGDVAPGALVYASGGSARVEFLSAVRPRVQVGADGGGAEVLRLSAVTARSESRR